MSHKNNKKITAIAALTALMMTFTSCADSSSSAGMYENSKSAMPTYSAENSASYGDTWGDAADDDTGSYFATAGLSLNDAQTVKLNANYQESPQTVLSSQKMVYTGSVALETLEYDNSVSSVRSDVEKYGGFVENSSESNSNRKWYLDDEVYEADRTLSITVRIPSEHFNEFLTGLSAYGQKMSESTNAENISRQYADNAAEVAALEKEQERLLEMMDAADTIQDMITVEDRLTEVQSQLNKYKSTLAAMDTDVQYSRITMTITEVHKYTEIQKQPDPDPTFLERLTEQVSNSAKSFLKVLEGLLFALIALFPYLLILTVIIVIVLSVRKKRREKILSTMPKAPSAPTKPEPYGKSGSDEKDKPDEKQD